MMRISIQNMRTVVENGVPKRGIFHESPEQQICAPSFTKTGH